MIYFKHILVTFTILSVSNCFQPDRLAATLPPTITLETMQGMA